MPESFSVRAILAATDSGFSSTLKNAQGVFSTLADKIKGGLAFGVLSGAGQQAFSALTNGAKNLIGEIDSSNAAWKTFASNMSIMGKGKGEIEAVKKEMQSFAEASIYNSSEMASTYAQLAAVGTKNTTQLVKGFGGLAAAANEPKQAMKTLSQQATQMAAKPKVAWQDFKLILDQTPAGIAAVAKEMGMSTEEMVMNVQDGKVSTDAFFQAIEKVGTNKSFSKLATEYKKTSEAMGGLTETLENKLGPAFDILSTKAIGGIESIIGKISQIDGDALASKLSAGIKTIQPYWDTFSEKASVVGAAFGDAFSAVGTALSKLTGSFGSAKSISSFSDVLDTICGALQRFAGFIEEHADTIALVITKLPALFVAYKGFSFLKSFNPFSIFKKHAEVAGDGVTKAIGKSKSTIAQIIGSIGGVVKNLGSAIKDSFVGIGTAAKGIGAGLQSAFKGIGAALKIANPVNILALGAAIGIVVASFALLATQGDGIATIIGSIGNIISNVASTVIESLANALVTLAPLLPAIAQSFALLSPLVAAFGKAFSEVTLAIGEAVSNIAESVSPIVEIIGGVFTQVVQIISDTVVRMIEAVSPVLPAITEAFTAITNTISNAIVQIVQAVAPYMPEMQKMIEVTTQAIQAVCTAFTSLVNQIAPIVGSVTDLVRQLGETIGKILQSVSEVVMSVSDGIIGIIESIGNAISGVINSIGTVFESLGNAALNAGKGFELLANGIKTITKLNLIDMGLSLGAVAAGIGAIVLASIGLSETGSGMVALAGGLLGVSMNGASASTAMAAISGATTVLMTTLAPLPSLLSSVCIAVLAFAKSVSGSVNGINSFGSAMGALRTNMLVMAQALAEATGQMKVMMSGTAMVGSSLSMMVISLKLVEAELNTLEATTQKSMTSLVNAMNRAAVQSKIAGQKVGNGFTKAMETALSKAPTVATRTISAVNSRFRAGRSGAYSAGAYISQGFAQGMQSQLSSIRYAAAQMAIAAERAIRAKAQIHSPSRVSDKLGGYYGTGYVNGILGMVRDAKMAAERLVSVPTISTPNLATPYGGGISEEYEYYRNAEYTIVVPLSIDGKEFAKTTASYTQDELDKRQNRNNRKHGRV